MAGTAVPRVTTSGLPQACVCMLEQPRRKSEPVSAKRFPMTTAPAMSPATATLTTLPEWRDLAVHAEEMRSVHLRSLFDADGTRGTRLVAEAGGLYMDYSKHRVRDETLERLFALARATRLNDRIEQMFRGDRINVTENRPVLHVALRAPRSASIVVDGRNVVEDVHVVLDRMADFANRVRTGAWTGFTGKRIRTIVNIGIGGSDLGPAMAYEALRFYSDRSLSCRFVSNVDGADFYEKTRGLDA